MPATFFVRKVKQHLGIDDDNYHLITFKDQDQVVTSFISDLTIQVKPGILIFTFQMVSQDGDESCITLPVRMGNSISTATRPSKQMELSLNNRLNNNRANRWGQYVQEYLWLILFEVIQNMKSLFNIQATAPLNAWYCDEGFLALVFNDTSAKKPLKDAQS